MVQQVELLLGSIGVILGFFFAAFLIATRKKYRSANIYLAIYLLAFSLRIGKSLFHNYFEINAGVRTFLLATLLAVGPSLWLYTKGILKSEVEPSRKHLWHFLPLAFFLIISWFIPNDGTPGFAWFYNGLIAHMTCYVLFAMYWIWQQGAFKLSSSENNASRWLVLLLVLNLVFLVFYFLVSQLIIPFYMGISILFSGVVIILSFVALLNTSLFLQPVVKYTGSSLDTSQSARIIERLKKLMEEEKPFLEASLKLSNLSQLLEVSSKELSQAINQIESLNFSQFVSQYRVREVQALMKEEKYEHFKIAAIAYECGFSSISAFNEAFKKQVGTTPLNYRKSLEK